MSRIKIYNWQQPDWPELRYDVSVVEGGLESYSQRHPTDNDSGLEVCIEVIPNCELEWLIQSFGDAIKVLEPVELCEMIRARYHEALNS